MKLILYSTILSTDLNLHGILEIHCLSRPSLTFCGTEDSLFIMMGGIRLLGNRNTFFKYRIFSNLIRTLLTVLEGLKIRCGLDLWSRAGFWKNAMYDSLLDFWCPFSVTTADNSTTFVRNLLGAFGISSSYAATTATFGT
jgi:hypothetical protein